MTPEQKAKELMYKMYYEISSNEFEEAKQCALIAVNEILNSNPTWFIDQMKSTHKYWESVKMALNDLKLKQKTIN